jgi:acetylornithine deacetylase/succinyl-diaminopimelate desuccinylase-like protein
LPETVTYEVFLHSGAPAYFLEEAPGMKNLTEAYKRVWDKEVVYKREGGSIPVATSMKNILGIDSLLTGFGLPDDQIHSPNEHLNLSNWKKGIEALIFFFSSFTQDRGI